MGGSMGGRATVHGAIHRQVHRQIEDRGSYVAPTVSGLSNYKCAVENSHSQHGADLFLLPFLLLATGGASGTFVEIGALDGVTFSNSFMLERCFNWTGLLIEANPGNFQKLKQAKRKANIVHSAVCEPEGFLNVSRKGGATSGSYSSMSPSFRSKWHPGSTHTSVLVPCSPLGKLMVTYGYSRANFLSLDVEGAEELVIKTIPPTAFDIIFVEMDGSNPAKDDRVHQYILSYPQMVHARYFRQPSNAIYMHTRLTVTPCGGGCWEGSGGKLFGGMPSHLHSPEHKVFQLRSQHDTKVNLNCAVAYASAFYHRIIDCFMPFLPLVEKANAAHGEVCYNWWMEPFFRVLAPNMRNTTGCPPRSEMASRQGAEEAAQRGYEIIEKLMSISSIRVPSRSHILYIRRLPERKRSFVNDTKLIDALSRSGSCAVKVFDGSGSVKDTISLFRGASAVVGYHGAGLANVVFALNGTVVVEVTTYTDMNGTHSWRTNMEKVTQWGTYVKHIIHIPLAELLRANTISHAKFGEVQDVDHFIKGLKYVPLAQREIETITRFLRSAAC